MALVSTGPAIPERSRGALIRRKTGLSLTPGGIGRHLEGAICRVGDTMAKKAGKYLHNHGYGPKATFNRILEHLEKDKAETLMQSHFRDREGRFSSEMVDDCRRLVAFALP